MTPKFNIGDLVRWEESGLLTQGEILHYGLAIILGLSTSRWNTISGRRTSGGKAWRVMFFYIDGPRDDALNICAREWVIYESDLTLVSKAGALK
jgi:hypothetical protein